MTRSVVAIDNTVFYASLCRITEGESRPLVGGVISKSIDGVQHHLSAEVRKQKEFAARVVSRIMAGGKPDLVVLRKPNVGAKDDSAARRLGVYWELVGHLDAEGIPIAEVPLYTVQRMLGLRANSPYADLAAKCLSMYPEAKAPDADGKTDARYRVSTIGLAVAGAVAAGIYVPIDINAEVLATVRKGGDFPPTLTPPWDDAKYRDHVASVSGERAAKRTADKATRASEWYEQQLEDIATLPMAELEKRFGGKPPRNATLKAAWRKRFGRTDEVLT